MNIFFIFGAKYLFVLSVVVAGVFFLYQPRPSQKKIAVLAALSGALSFVIGILAGFLYANPRPFVSEHITPLIPHAPNNGFPSDHALLVGLIASVIYPFNRRVSAVLWIIAITVAASRVVVGVHHSLDVVTSFVITITITACGYWLVEGPLRPWLTRNHLN